MTNIRSKVLSAHMLDMLGGARRSRETIRYALAAARLSSGRLRDSLRDGFVNFWRPVAAETWVAATLWSRPKQKSLPPRVKVFSEQVHVLCRHVFDRWVDAALSQADQADEGSASGMPLLSSVEEVHMSLAGELFVPITNNVRPDSPYLGECCAICLRYHLCEIASTLRAQFQHSGAGLIDLEKKIGGFAWLGAPSRPSDDHLDHLDLLDERRKGLSPPESDDSLKNVFPTDYLSKLNDVGKGIITGRFVSPLMFTVGAAFSIHYYSTRYIDGASPSQETTTALPEGTDEISDEPVNVVLISVSDEPLPTPQPPPQPAAEPTPEPSAPPPPPPATTPSVTIGVPPAPSAPSPAPPVIYTSTVRPPPAAERVSSASYRGVYVNRARSCYAAASFFGTVLIDGVTVTASITVNGSQVSFTADPPIRRETIDDLFQQATKKQCY